MKVLMVCLGNICRSPMAEGVLRQLANERGLALEVDSAGTADYHVGEAPDHRARASMKRHGGNIEALRARQVSTKDFERFDIILAMDGNNERDLRRLAPSDTARRKVRRMMEFATAQGTGEVPDPYYGADSGFDEVHRMLMDACRGFVDAHFR
ncbi:MAG: low molecular weight phosphotyrosine protein phosphatase [Flavobacteriales bacterium]|nr:MAG: low molecular weight phosphotyrosine protein phosphatase [Flavobacteriales bacterium]